MRMPADLAAAMEAITAAVARGMLAPAEAAEFAKVVNTSPNAIEVRDFESRLRTLEESRAAKLYATAARSLHQVSQTEDMLNLGG
jgi:hypothetical protein